MSTPRNQRARELLALFLAIAGLLIPLASQIRQGSYLWFVAPFLALIPLRIWLPSASINWRAGLSFAPLAAAFLLFGVFGISDTLCRWLSPPEQGFSVQQRLLQEKIPAGSRVLGTPIHWPILGEDRFFYDTLDGGHKTVDEIDYVIVGSVGSGKVGRPHPLPPTFQAALEAGRLECIHDSIDTQERRLFGIKLSNSANGAGFLLYRVKRDAVRN